MATALTFGVLIHEVRGLYGAVGDLLSIQLVCGGDAVDSRRVQVSDANVCSFEQTVPLRTAMGKVPGTGEWQANPLRIIVKTSTDAGDSPIARAIVNLADFVDEGSGGPMTIPLSGIGGVTPTLTVSIDAGVAVASSPVRAGSYGQPLSHQVPLERQVELLREQNDAHKRTVEALEAANLSLREALQQRSDATVRDKDRLEALVMDLEKQNEQQHAVIQDLRESNRNLQESSLSAMEANSRNSQTDRAAYESQLESLRSQQTAHTSEIRELREKLAAAETLSVRQERTIRDLANYKRTLQEVLQQRISGAARDRGELENRLVELGEQHAADAAAARKLHETNQQLEDEIARIKADRSNSQHNRRESESLIRQLQSQVASLDAQNARLTADLRFWQGLCQDLQHNLETNFGSSGAMPELLRSPQKALQERAAADRSSASPSRITEPIPLAEPMGILDTVAADARSSPRPELVRRPSIPGGTRRPPTAAARRPLIRAQSESAVLKDKESSASFFDDLPETEPQLGKVRRPTLGSERGSARRPPSKSARKPHGKDDDGFVSSGDEYEVDIEVEDEAAQTPRQETVVQYQMASPSHPFVQFPGPTPPPSPAQGVPNSSYYSGHIASNLPSYLQPFGGAVTSPPKPHPPPHAYAPPMPMRSPGLGAPLAPSPGPSPSRQPHGFPPMRGSPFQPAPQPFMRR